jgi:hypothetical protein
MQWIPFELVKINFIRYAKLSICIAARYVEFHKGVLIAATGDATCSQRQYADMRDAFTNH